MMRWKYHITLTDITRVNHCLLQMLLSAWQGVGGALYQSPLDLVSQRLEEEFKSQIADIKNKTLNVLVHEVSMTHNLAVPKELQYILYYSL